MWPQLALAAAPYLLSSFQDAPERPAAPAPVELPNRDKYFNSILNTAFNPNDEVWGRTMDMATERLNRDLMRSGLAGSSAGAQVKSMNMSDMATAYLNEQLERQQNALQLVSGYDMDKGRLQRGISQDAYNNELGGYQDQMQRQSNAVAGLGGLFNAGANIYGEYQGNQRAEQIRQENRDFMREMYTGGQPQYGVPTPVMSGNRYDPMNPGG